MPLIDTLTVDVPGAVPRKGEGIPRVRGPNCNRPGCGATLPEHSKFGPECDTLYGLFIRSAQKYALEPCQGTRVKLSDGKAGPYEYIDYSTTLSESLIIGSGLAGLGILVPGDGIGMYAANSARWQQAALGGFSQSLTCVPIYDTLGADAVRYEIDHAELKLVFCDTTKLKSIIPCLGICPSLKAVVLMGEDATLDNGTESKFTTAGVKVLNISSLMELGRSSPKEPRPPMPESLAFIMYTSGTTGDPKGVMLTHHAMSIGASYIPDAGIDVGPGDTTLSYLPLAHIFECMIEYALWSFGAKVGYYGGNIKNVMDDVAACQPTIFIGVPRIYSRVYDLAMAKANSSKLVGALFKCCMAMEKEALRAGTRSIIAAALFGPTVRKKLGGKCRILISGAAPLPSHVHEFLVLTMGCDVLQGYGMTENCANSTLQHIGDYTSGHVGTLVYPVHMKLVDVPDMDYLSSNNPPCGEICIKGPIVFSGYYKNKEATAETIDADGWQHSGDIGRWNPDGSLSIIDRKKNIFKLAQGEYIAAEKIEMIMSKAAVVGQIFIYGNSFFTMLVAIVVPDFDALGLWAKANGKADLDRQSLCALPEVNEYLMSEMKAQAKDAKLHGFEVPKACFVVGEVNELMQGFSVENGCLTPTFKLKRPAVQKMWQKEINSMYTALGEDISKQK